MVILFAGKYTGEYNRDKIILDGLRKRNDVEVLEYKFHKKKEFDLSKFKSLVEKSDFVYCPSFSHKFVRLIKRHSNKPIIFDPLISNYLTKVFDYKNVKKWSPRAYRNFLKDKLPFKAADLLIADTIQHKKYYNNTFGIPLEKIEVIPVGANTSDFNVSSKSIDNKIFKVGFYGGFIPLQGVKFIIEAAKILKNNSSIKFNLIGTGYQWEEMKKKVKDLSLSNVCFDGWIEYSKLSSKLDAFDVCLGIFGETPKAFLVIPNKIYHYAAKGKAIITMESPAIREIFKKDENIILCENDGKSIADAILNLKSDRSKRETLGKSVRLLAESNFSEDIIAEKLVLKLLKHF